MDDRPFANKPHPQLPGYSMDGLCLCFLRHIGEFSGCRAGSALHQQKKHDEIGERVSQAGMKMPSAKIVLPDAPLLHLDFFPPKKRKHWEEQIEGMEVPGTRLMRQWQ
jgi:hypothetical protein